MEGPLSEVGSTAASTLTIIIILIQLYYNIGDYICHQLDGQLDRYSAAATTSILIFILQLSVAVATIGFASVTELAATYNEDLRPRLVPFLGLPERLDNAISTFAIGLPGIHSSKLKNDGYNNYYDHYLAYLMQSYSSFLPSSPSFSVHCFSIIWWELSGGQYCTCTSSSSIIIMITAVTLALALLLCYIAYCA